MRNKLFSVFVFVLSVFSFFSCSDNIVPDFSFTPEVPKAGALHWVHSVCHELRRRSGAPEIVALKGLAPHL